MKMKPCGNRDQLVERRSAVPVLVTAHRLAAPTMTTATTTTDGNDNNRRRLPPINTILYSQHRVVDVDVDGVTNNEGRSEPTTGLGRRTK